MSSEQSANTPSFEQSMQELESIVKHMEQGDLPLEEALKQFERGIQLARQSQKTLQQAEQKVQVLMRQNGEETLNDLEASQSHS